MEPEKFLTLLEFNSLLDACGKLGAKTVDDLYATPKPKGMHQKAYDRLYDEAIDLDLKASRAIMRKFEGLLQLSAHLEDLNQIQFRLNSI